MGRSKGVIKVLRGLLISPRATTRPSGMRTKGILSYQWIDKGKDAQGKATHWTFKKLGMEIEEVFGVKMTKTPLWLLVRSMGFRQSIWDLYQATHHARCPFHD